MSSSKKILVTGCSSKGIGAELALEIAKRGHTVFATARNPAKIPSELTNLSNVHVLTLDVTSAASVEDAVAAVKKHGEGCLDVLVNNAGRGYTMPLLDVDIEEAKTLHDANVWGCLRATQGFADLLIASKGRVVMMSSVGGATNTPWIGVYCSSKAALNRISGVLRLELAPFGVSVVTVMLGRVSTPFHTNEPEFRLPPGSRYAPIESTIARWSRGEPGPKAGPVEALVAELVDDVVVSQSTAPVWKGAWAGSLKIISGWVPEWLLDYFVKQDQGLYELASSPHGK